MLTVDDVSKSKLLAARVELSALLRDSDEVLADWICENINRVLIAENRIPSPLHYTSGVRQLFRRAWYIAAQLQNRSVAVEHVLVALARSDEEASAALGSVDDGVPAAILAGSLVLVAVLT